MANVEKHLAAARKYDNLPFTVTYTAAALMASLLLLAISLMWMYHVQGSYGALFWINAVGAVLWFYNLRTWYGDRRKLNLLAKKFNLDILQAMSMYDAIKDDERFWRAMADPNTEVIAKAVTSREEAEALLAEQRTSHDPESFVNVEMPEHLSRARNRVSHRDLIKRRRK